MDKNQIELQQPEQRLLRMFKERAGEYISGEEISRQLGISRTAVWKQINKLRETGYEFEAVSRKGYRLTGEPSRLAAADLMLAARTSVMGRNLKLLDVTGSTQDEARLLAEQGAPEGTLVIAEEQTKGKGRMGRSWYSPPGNGLWMSLLLRPNLPLGSAPQLTLLMAVAVCRAIRSVAGVDAGIKWPNDILISGRKTSGILLESTGEDERIRYCIAGIGIDVNMAAGELPEDLRAIMTSLRIESGQKINRSELAGTILNETEQLYGIYMTEGFGPIAALWEALSISLDKPVTVQTPAGEVKGTAVSLDSSGALIVRLADGQTTKIISGDVTVDPLN
ncbi:biotin--[acetyl-CoA-carboxylase] ligase [Paenibacillus yonginensis]|uniref:Bifunctional ligase/repressor BirA n=1 Tax=Paenibacillus yonginensis TaxID=1462996 RepID=A0A1B1N080_9BACL|nr:biotin--[acetyl-CoA-carboxylase] ligase [Paenibacillus yonginensis]ANS74832.1 biotin--[acetyl-CoA-carboxylase] ligase [Paenibacillus yonginensis]